MNRIAITTKHPQQPDFFSSLTSCMSIRYFISFPSLEKTSPEFHFLPVYEKSVFILLSAIIVIPASGIPFRLRTIVMAPYGTGRTAASFRPVRLLSRKTVILLPRAASFAAKLRGAFVKIVLIAAVAHGSPKPLLSNPLVTESIVVPVIVAISFSNIFPKMSVGTSHGIPPTVRAPVDIAFRTNPFLRFGNSGLCLGFREERIRAC